MKTMKFFAFLLLGSLLTISCGERKEDKQEKAYSNLPESVREQVMALDSQIRTLQKEMEENMRKFQKQESLADDEVFDEWQKFSESVKQGERFQDKANQLREQIIKLQQEKVRLLEKSPSASS